MTRTLVVRSAAAIVTLAGAWIAYTQTKQPPPPMAVVKVADDLYVIQNNGAGNVAVYLTDEGTILVDDKFDQNFDEIMADVKKLTDKPVKYLMSTHHHGDHTGGSAKFLAAGTEIIAQKNNRANMVRGKQPGVPHVVFTEEADVYLGGKQVEARYFGRGHTNGDAVIFFPGLRTIHTGDLMAGTSPLIDYANGGSLKEWTATLDGVLKNDFDTVIPGHGDVHKRADLIAYRNDIEKLRTRVSGLVRQGKSKEEVAKVLVEEFHWDPNGLAMRASLDGMMNELKN